MRLRLTFAEALSGSIAGVTATNGRPGAQVRARRPHVQPRTPSQVNSRALLGQIPALWRLLTPAQQLSWAQLAKIAPRRAAFGAQRALSGYALFVSCNRNLATIGAPLLDTAADTARSFPPIHTFSAAPGYNQPNQPRYLNSLPVQIDPTIPAPFVAVIRATKGLSPGQMQIRPSDLRIVATFEACPTYTADIYPGWVAAFGAPISRGRVTLTATLIDPASGFAGQPVICDCSYIAPAPPVITPGLIAVEQNGTVIAEEPDSVISFGGVPTAGG